MLIDAVQQGLIQKATDGDQSAISSLGSMALKFSSGREHNVKAVSEVFMHHISQELKTIKSDHSTSGEVIAPVTMHAFESLYMLFLDPKTFSQQSVMKALYRPFFTPIDSWKSLLRWTEITVSKALQDPIKNRDLIYKIDRLFYLFIRQTDPEDNAVWATAQETKTLMRIFTKMWFADEEGQQMTICLPHLMLFQTFEPKDFLEAYKGSKHDLARILVSRIDMTHQQSIQDGTDFGFELEVMARFTHLLVMVENEMLEYCIIEGFIKVYLQILEARIGQARRELDTMNRISSAETIVIATKMIDDLGHAFMLGPSQVVEALDAHFILIMMRVSHIWDYPNAGLDESQLDDLAYAVEQALPLVQEQAYHYRVARHLLSAIGPTLDFTRTMISSRAPFSEAFSKLFDTIASVQNLTKSYKCLEGRPRKTLCSNPKVYQHFSFGSLLTE
jgi:hypothetical protein